MIYLDFRCKLRNDCIEIDAIKHANQSNTCFTPFTETYKQLRHHGIIRSKIMSKGPFSTRFKTVRILLTPEEAYCYLTPENKFQFRGYILKKFQK